MKLTRLLIAASLLVTPMAMPNLAQAKSVKWSCYAPDPTKPQNMVCTGTTNRP